MSKKVLSLVLALVMVLGSFSFVSAAAYPDVKGDTAEAVDRLSLLGILEGYPDGTFKPEGQITRAEFAAVAVRAKGLKAVAEAAQGLPTGFSDVPGTFWASGVVGTAGRLGIVNGVGNGLYAPQAPVKYEEAITMLVRALGYEAAAQAKGGYPYGYLIVANEVGLLEAVKGTQGVPATRGIVAQLTDNALEVAMMVQVGYGDSAKWVVSGSKEHGDDAIYLLDAMGFDVVEGRVTAYDADDLEITINKKDYEVAEGFDFYAVEGLEIKAWTNKGEVIVYTAKDEAKFDATTGGTKIKLVGENKSYVVARDAVLVLDGEEEKAADFTADYAKVVLNDANEVVWAKGYAWDDTFVADKTDKDVIYSVDKDELKVKDYEFVKEGKSISLDDVKEEDLLFFNKANKFAVVYNNSKTGEIERVYDLSFKFAGKTYDYDAGNYDVKFVDEDVVGAVDKDIMAALKDEGEVEVFFDFAGKAVLVVGDRGIEKTDYFYGVVTGITKRFQTRGDYSWTFDVLNEEGKVVKYDLKESFVIGSDKKYTGPTWNDTNIKEDVVVKVTLNDKSEITAIENLGAGVAIANIKIDATYAAGYRLQDSTVVFLAEGKTAVKDYEVMTWAKAKDAFKEIEDGLVFAGERGRAGVLFVEVTDNVPTDHVGLVTDVRKVRSTSNVWDVTIELNGEEKVYSTVADLDLTALVDKIVKITLTSKDKISAASEVTAPIKQTGLVTDIRTSGKTITVGTSVYELVEDAVIYDKTNNFAELSLRDLNEGDEVAVYRLDTNTTRFVEYVVRTAKAPATGGSGRVTGDATVRTAFAKSSIDQNIYLTVNGNLKVYNLLGSALVENASGAAQVDGFTVEANKVINFVLVEGTTNIAYIKVLN